MKLSSVAKEGAICSRSLLRGLAPLVVIACVLSTVSLAWADVLNNPVHSHAASPVVTWNDGHAPVENHFHQHRTNHHVNGTGASDHGAVAHYTAFGTWQNDGTFHWFLGGAAAPTNAKSKLHEEWGHGHVVPENAIPYRVQTAEVGGDITQAKADAWNGVVGAGAIPRVDAAFDAWEAIANAGGGANWPTSDNDHVAGTGVPWISRLNFNRVTAGHTINIRLGEASSGEFCGASAIGCWDPGSLTLIMDDDQSWYYGTSTDKTVAPNDMDFLSTVIHEVGHVTGLLHFATFAAGGIMTDDDQTIRNNATAGGDGNGQGIFRTIDESSIHGERDMYAIAVPEPGTLVLLTVGLACLMHRRQRG